MLGVPQVTHSLLFGVLLVSMSGFRRAAVIGVVSHLCLGLVTGGVRLLVPLDDSLNGLEFSRDLANAGASSQTRSE